ncbi:MAG: hypothetical protein MUP49_06285, partial [Dehalococcoidia bacterium]|nr:hypothetical protein [Dehalococcoidia bacterium]
MVEISSIKITKSLPATAEVGSTYKIEGSAKVFGALGAPPFIYAQVRHKEWNKPDFAEEKDYIRAWPVPITGGFSIEFKPEKEGDYEVKVIATPAPLSIPVVGVFPIVGESDVMKVDVGEKPASVFHFSSVMIDGNTVQLGNHDADSQLLLKKNTSGSLVVRANYEWVGESKSATI